ncbi:hypothetical protein GCK32_020895 [Trichostrongylus colubriformis]|uniref:Uncharacterized protein n=1 Tax=Trichostrongylus colubriformis TaxID=6319 RepID=A0AAN8I9P6_TRICO
MRRGIAGHHSKVDPGSKRIIATDSDLTFTFNSRRCGEYCFESNRKNGRMVVFGDTGSEIRVAQKIGDEEVSVETWRKSDWLQFCWAVRGTCVHFLKV